MTLGSGETLSLAFPTIQDLIPREFFANKDQTGTEGFQLRVPKKLIQDQLRQGAVKIPFGEVRRAAPPGLFVNNSAHDDKLVDLPLKEILNQLQPDALGRQSQKRTEVPDDVTEVFGAKGEQLAQVRVSATVEKVKPESASKPKSGTPSRTLVTPHPPSVARAAVPLQTASPLAAPSPLTTPKNAATAPARPGPDCLTIELSAVSSGWPESVRREIAGLNLTNATCELPVAEIGKALRTGKIQFPWKRVRTWIKPAPAKKDTSPDAVILLELPLKVVAPLYLAHSRAAQAQRKSPVGENIPDVFSRSQPPTVPAKPSAPAPAEAVPSQEPSVPFPPGALQGTITLSLSEVSAKWPEAVRKEIDSLQISEVNLEVPVDAVEAGLKLGKIECLWKQLCHWMKPASPAALASAQGETRLELPLNVVAPLFLQRRTSQPQRKTKIASDIPDLFSATGQPTAEKASAEKSPAAVSAAAAPRATQDSVAQAAPTATQKEPENLAELFGEPEKRNWTPNEIVHKASLLPGVAGSLIALQDGLLVAACMPPIWKTETIAAFLPQIFGRMNQYSKELKMGDLNSINFTVEQGALHIFNAGIIYFAALSRPGENLPLPQLRLIASELSRHTK